MLAAAVAATGGLAVADEPGEAALAHLSRLQGEDLHVLEVLKDSLLSPRCGPERRDMIAAELRGLARELREGKYRFEVVDEKREGDYAAVLVAATSAHDPLDVDVLALGMGRKEGEWRAAPMPGTFDNVDIRFDEELERRLGELEIGMGAERVRQLLNLNETAEDRFRELMSKAVPGPALAKATPAEYVTSFLAECREGDLAAAMRWLSGFEDGLSEEDRELHRTISKGLEGLDRRDHWRLVTSPDVVRVVVQDDPGDDLDAEVDVLYFDPDASDAAGVLRFVLLRSGDRWEIELPSSLRLADQSRMEFQGAIWRQDHGDDEELADKFEEYFEEEHAPLRADTLEAAGRQIEKTLREGTLGEFFRHIHREEELSDGERHSAYRSMAKYWSDFHGHGAAAADGELIGVMQEGSAGLVVFHLITTAEIAKLEDIKLVPLLMIHGTDGWAIAPGVSTTGNHQAHSKNGLQEQARVMAAFNEQKGEFARKAVAGFLGRFVAAVPAEGARLGEEEAATLVRTFRECLRKSDLLGAFERCALLDPEEGAWEALRVLSYEHRGAQQARLPDQLLGVGTSGPWGAVSMRVDSGSDSVPVYPMYLVVASEEGPRIVVDVGLRMATNKGREVLNRRDWDRIEEQLEDKQTALVRTLFQGHVERSKSDLAEWEKSNSNR